ncbi:MAG: asparagine synthase (glutamine-hydrolyzing) [Gemmatimonadetes bacterium]|nr:asparagine synthase (glutamine-hydrolyzing) [Gemmatimonadota bacterium]
MCGILVGVGLDAPFSHRSLAPLRRRGPDQLGFWTDGRVQMGLTRLAIIGLDERAAGPLENATHVLAYNGEIYNFVALRDALSREGIVLPGANDAEVLLHAWTRWGAAVLPRLEGFWAFVVYDKVRRTLTCVRDQFGVKPLYLWRGGDRVIVSSLLRSVAETHGPGLALDDEALSAYARYQFTFGGQTFFREVRAVPPGHLLEVPLDGGATRTVCYDDLLGMHGTAPVTPAWIEDTRALLREGTLASTVSDTPVTTLCSGGLDSTLLTRLVRPDVAYHANYADPDCNETAWAKLAVEDLPTRLFTVNAQEEVALVDRLTSLLEDVDDPAIGAVILPLDDLFAQVRRRYKVVLTGTGGDELFAGYARYLLARGVCPQESYRALHERLRTLPTSAARFEATHVKGDVSLYRFYDPAVERQFAEAFAACAPEQGALGAMLRFDRRHFLTGLLTLDDRIAGRHSLEARPSLLHQRLVRQVLAVDPADLLRGDTLKPVLRQLAAPFVPEAIAQRADKMGFTTPIGTFVNQSASAIREQLTTSRFRDRYDLRRLNFTAGSKYAREVFGLLMLDLWLHRYA